MDCTSQKIHVLLICWLPNGRAQVSASIIHPCMPVRGISLSSQACWYCSCMEALGGREGPPLLSLACTREGHREGNPRKMYI